MAHPSLRRTTLTAGLATALLTLPFSGAAFALGTGDSVVSQVESVLPAPVAEAVDKAVSPVTETVVDEVAPVADAVVEKAPDPVRSIVESVVPSGPSAGPVAKSPLAPRTSPRGGGAYTPVPEQGAAAPSAAHVSDSPLQRARHALASTPSTFTPFPTFGLISADAPVAADGQTQSAVPVGGGAPGWLVATATAMLVVLGAAHVAYADNRLSGKTVSAA